MPDMKKPDILMICGGGHCRSCIDVIEKEDKYAIAGIIDIKENIGKRVLGYPVIASDEKLIMLAKRYKNGLVSSAPIKMMSKKKYMFEAAEKAGFRFPAIISPRAYISRYARIGEGTIVMHDCLINAGAKIGRNCVINTGSIVEHDSVIGDHCNISTGVIVNGECRIGNTAFIGSGSVVSNRIDIAPGTIVGAGSVVVRSIKKRGVYAGNPSRIIG